MKGMTQLAVFDHAYLNGAHVHAYIVGEYIPLGFEHDGE
jgi:hypothetical protein